MAGIPNPGSLPTTADPDTAASSAALDQAEIIGIIIGIAVLIAGIIIVIVLLVHWRKKKNSASWDPPKLNADSGEKEEKFVYYNNHANRSIDRLFLVDERGSRKSKSKIQGLNLAQRLSLPRKHRAVAAVPPAQQNQDAGASRSPQVEAPEVPKSLRKSYSTGGLKQRTEPDSLRTMDMTRVSYLDLTCVSLETQDRPTGFLSKPDLSLSSGSGSSGWDVDLPGVHTNPGFQDYMDSQLEPIQEDDAEVDSSVSVTETVSKSGSDRKILDSGLDNSRTGSNPPEQVTANKAVSAHYNLQDPSVLEAKLFCQETIIDLDCTGLGEQDFSGTSTPYCKGKPDKKVGNQHLFQPATLDESVNLQDMFCDSVSGVGVLGDSVCEEDSVDDIPLAGDHASSDKHPAVMATEDKKLSVDVVTVNDSHPVTCVTESVDSDISQTSGGRDSLMVGVEKIHSAIESMLSALEGRFTEGTEGTQIQTDHNHNYDIDIEHISKAVLGEKQQDSTGEVCGVVEFCSDGAGNTVMAAGEGTEISGKSVPLEFKLQTPAVDTESPVNGEGVSPTPTPQPQPPGCYGITTEGQVVGSESAPAGTVTESHERDTGSTGQTPATSVPRDQAVAVTEGSEACLISSDNSGRKDGDSFVAMVAGDDKDAIGGDTNETKTTNSPIKPNLPQDVFGYINWIHGMNLSVTEKDLKPFPPSPSQPLPGSNPNVKDDSILANPPSEHSFLNRATMATPDWGLESDSPQRSVSPEDQPDGDTMADTSLRPHTEAAQDGGNSEITAPADDKPEQSHTENSNSPYSFITDPDSSLHSEFSPCTAAIPLQESMSSVGGTPLKLHLSQSGSSILDTATIQTPASLADYPVTMETKTEHPVIMVANTKSSIGMETKTEHSATMESNPQYPVSINTDAASDSYVVVETDHNYSLQPDPDHDVSVSFCIQGDSVLDTATLESPWHMVAVATENTGSQDDNPVTTETSNPPVAVTVPVQEPPNNVTHTPAKRPLPRPAVPTPRRKQLDIILFPDGEGLVLPASYIQSSPATTPIRSASDSIIRYASPARLDPTTPLRTEHERSNVFSPAEIQTLRTGSGTCSADSSASNDSSISTSVSGILKRLSDIVSIPHQEIVNAYKSWWHRIHNPPEMPSPEDSISSSREVQAILHQVSPEKREKRRSWSESVQRDDDGRYKTAVTSTGNNRNLCLQVDGVYDDDDDDDDNDGLHHSKTNSSPEDVVKETADTDSLDTDTPLTDDSSDSNLPPDTDPGKADPHILDNSVTMDDESFLNCSIPDAGNLSVASVDSGQFCFPRRLARVDRLTTLAAHTLGSIQGYLEGALH